MDAQLSATARPDPRTETLARSEQVYRRIVGHAERARQRRFVAAHRAGASDEDVAHVTGLTPREVERIRRGFGSSAYAVSPRDHRAA